MTDVLMKKLFYIIISFLLGGCISPSPSLEEIHIRVARQVEALIDSNYLQTSYVEIYELLPNDSNIFYYIKESDSPASAGAELPSRVIKYKDRYLCFIELDEPEMSRTELFGKGIVPDSNFHENLTIWSDDNWLLALRKYKNEFTLIKDTLEYNYTFEYPELWSYFSGDSPQGKTAFMALLEQNIIVSRQYDSILYDLDIDSMKNYIKSFSGDIYIKNMTDSLLLLSNNPIIDMSFAVVNGADTLKLILQKSLPIVVEPYGFKYLPYRTKPPQSFLQKLPNQDNWMSMYKLFCDSTFCFLDINHIPQEFRILHNDIQITNFLKIDSVPSRTRYFHNKGIYNKEERMFHFFKNK